MKKSVLACSIAAIAFGTGAAHAAVQDVETLELDDGSFEMQGGAPGGAFNIQKDIQAGSYQDGILTFDFFSQPVTAYTADSVAGISGGGPAPNGSVDTDAGTINMDLSSWFANWNGNDFNQGSDSASGSYDPDSNEFSLEWDSTIVGGAFDGQTGLWSLSGEAMVAATTPPEDGDNGDGSTGDDGNDIIDDGDDGSDGIEDGDGGYNGGNDSTPVPAPATVLLLGSGLLGWAGLSRRKQQGGRV